MRILILFLAFMLLAPAAPAAGCDGNSMVMDLQHQEHGSMEHHKPQEPSKHDCCEKHDRLMTDDCSQMQFCGAATGSSLIESGLFYPVAYWKEHFSLDPFSGLLPPSHSHPPYRPPAV
jgi:hypothetical protein